jgi:glutaryl-CoA dehydrogenase (non-decarboxylating)
VRAEAAGIATKRRSQAAGPTCLEGVHDFVERSVAPAADVWDARQQIPRDVIEAVARAGYFGAIVPPEYGGLGLDPLSYGLLHGEIGRGCSSLRSILTVHGMVVRAIARWGSPVQRETWLPRLAYGELIAGLALSEPNAGSDLSGLETVATRVGDTLLLRGRKSWTTAGQLADVFLVFARLDGQSVALLVEAEQPGLRRLPVRDLVGVRASMVAHLELHDCAVPEDGILGRPGFGVSHVGGTALHDGRYTVAWGCVGAAQACLEASVAHASQRRQFQRYLREHQLVQRMLTNMIVDVESARLLCVQAAHDQESGGPTSVVSTAMAKYAAANAFSRVSRNAVQIQGAKGCSGDSAAQRHFRDAKIMEIIEGSNEMQQIMIAQNSTAWVTGELARLDRGLRTRARRPRASTRSTVG